MTWWPGPNYCVFITKILCWLFISLCPPSVLCVYLLCLKYNLFFIVFLFLVSLFSYAVKEIKYYTFFFIQIKVTLLKGVQGWKKYIFIQLNSLLKNIESENESHSVMSNCLRPLGLYSPWNTPGQNTWVGRISFLQGIFPIRGLNPSLPHCIFTHGKPPKTYKKANLKMSIIREFPGGQWLWLHALTAKGPGSISGQGTKISQAMQCSLNK